MRFYVLRASMEHEVLFQLDVVEVVTIDRNWFDNVHMQILQQSLDPYRLTGCDDPASVLNSATVGSSLLLHAITPLPRENVKPDVDWKLEASPTQSTSM